jgi:uncharacterized protein YdhG (YjbR/CyaY superfamily)
MIFSKEIDQYIQTFPEETKEKLNTLRVLIQKEVPNAIETFKYGMPTFDLYGNLVHFSGYKNHIGFYPTPSGLQAFESEIKKYNNSKGAVQFPLNQPLPIELIRKIVKFRVKQNTESFIEGNKKAAYFFIEGLSAPAQRALISKNIFTLEELSKFTKAQILAFHGIGKTTVPILEKALSDKNLTFKD